MKAGIIGSGDVGRVLATGLLKEGYDVMLGSRSPGKAEVVQWQTDNPTGKTGTFAEAGAFGDILIIAVKGTIAKEAIDLTGKAHFSGKVVIDATNPIANEAPVNGVLKYFTTMDESLMEQLQQYLPDARLVKAFSCVGNPLMYKPDFKDGQPTMFICGNDEAAKTTVTGILEAFGWDTEDMGKAEAARAIEPLCILWCLPGFVRNQWRHAFKLLKQ